MHVFGHVQVLRERQNYARSSYENLYTELFREETKLGHLFARVNKGSESFCHSLTLGVDGLKV